MVTFSSGLLIDQATRRDWVLRSCSVAIGMLAKKDGARAALEGTALQHKVFGEHVPIQGLDHSSSGSLNRGPLDFVTTLSRK